MIKNTAPLPYLQSGYLLKMTGYLFLFIHFFWISLDAQVTYRTFSEQDLPDFSKAIDIYQADKLEQLSGKKDLIFDHTLVPECFMQYRIRGYFPNFGTDSVLVNIYYKQNWMDKSPLVRLTEPSYYVGQIPIGLFLKGVYYVTIERDCTAIMVLSTTAIPCPITRYYHQCPN